MGDDIEDPWVDFSGSGPVEYYSAEATSHGELQQMLAREEARLLAIPGVTSVGIGLGPAGGEAILVGVVDAGVEAQVPAEIGGVPVTVTVTGYVDALPQR